MRPSQSSVLPPFLSCRLRMLAAVVLLAGNPVLAADSPIKSIEVTFEGDAYVANAVFQTSAPPDIAWDVLTDFDNLAKWVPNVTESKVLKRDENSVIVEQKGMTRYGLVNFAVYVPAEDRTEAPDQHQDDATEGQHETRRIDAADRARRQGHAHRVSPRDRAQRCCSGGMSTEFVESEVREQFTAIVGEMARRRVP